MTSKFFSTAAVVLLGLGVISPLAQAKPEAATLFSQQQAPQIDSFTVSSVDQLSPGNELVFTLRGTPNAQATFTVDNIANNLPMREIEPGIYEGRYTIRTQDRLSENTVVRANLAQGNQISSVRLQEPLVASNPNSFPGNQSTQTPYIDSFTTNSGQNLTPGSTLVFTLVGTPNATATFTIDGITTDQPMQEIRRGTYQGEYVIRRQDNFSNESINAIAKLETTNGQIARARLEQNSTASNIQRGIQLPLEVLSPQNNSSVNGTVEVTGRSAPNTTINVNVKASNSLAGIVGINRDVLNRTIQTDAQGNFRFQFDPLVNIGGTRYEVSLRATNGDQTNEETLVLIQQ